MLIPYEKLTPEALHSLITEFVSASDDNGQDIASETKIEKIIAQLKTGEILITYDKETESCNILLKKEYDSNPAPEKADKKSSYSL